MPVRQTLVVSAMTGNHCVATVASGLQHLSGAWEVAIDMAPSGTSRVHVVDRAGAAAQAVDLTEFVSNSCDSPSVAMWRTMKAHCPTRQSPSPR